MKTPAEAPLLAEEAGYQLVLLRGCYTIFKDERCPETGDRPRVMAGWEEEATAWESFREFVRRWPLIAALP